MGKSNISINGKTFTGNNVNIVGDKAVVDGKEINLKDYADEDLNLYINIEGMADRIEVQNAKKLNVYGDVSELETFNGDIDVHGSVMGDIETFNGNVTCQVVEGDIETFNGNITKTK